MPGHFPTRLTKPILLFSAAGLALSFLPEDTEEYTYHHLRRDLFDMISSTGVKLSPRYVALTAHITLARFVSNDDFEKDGCVDHDRVQAWLSVIDNINAWLKSFWEGEKSHLAEWSVDNVECRVGTNWYGGGHSLNPDE